MPSKLQHTIPFDVADWLDDDETICAYLQEFINNGNAAELAEALGDVARARGMTEVAARAGITREALYKALRPGAQPRFETVQRVCGALGLRLQVEVASETNH